MVKIAHVMTALSVCFSLPKCDLKEAYGPHVRTKIKHVGIYVASELTGRSNRELAHAFGLTDHTSTIYARHRIEAAISGGDTSVIQMVSELRSAVKIIAERANRKSARNRADEACRSVAA